MQMKAWHYTTGEKFERIVRSGFLLAATAHIEPNERPVVWFSTNQHWEGSASKGQRQPDGSTRWLSMDETCLAGRGLVRFGMDESRLSKGAAIQHLARIPAKTWEGLCRAAAVVGASPSEWRAIAGPIPIEDLEIHVLNDANVWERVDA
jgi:hypothetical protein